MTKKYTYYPGCSSEGSASHLDKSIRAIAPRLGIEIEDIEDWNCCGASVGELAAGQLSNAALSGRNLAQAREQGEQDVMTPCAACYLNTHGTNEHIREDEGFKADMNEALAAAGKSYDGDLHVRHACEVLVNDVGIDAIKEQVTNPLDGIKIAGYVGCQTVRPFAGTERGGDYDNYDQPEFLDNFINATGAEAIDFDNATSCCGGAVAVMKPEKTLHLMKKILEEAQAKGADAIATPCPLCQTNVEMYQDQINKEFGTNFQIPVVFYSQLMALAFGMDANRDACLNQNTIKADKLVAKAKS
jgi:heterodisulfide reductase subunit B2